MCKKIQDAISKTAQGLRDAGVMGEVTLRELKTLIPALETRRTPHDGAASGKLASSRYLKDAALRRKLILNSVASSSAIEGIRSPFKKEATAKKAVAPTARVRKR